ELHEKLLDRIIVVATMGTFKEDFTPLEYTGIVVAGYGEKQFMPQLEQFRVYGLLNNTLVRTRLDAGCTSIRHDNNSEIVPLAQSNMINTFRLGADVTTLEEIDGYASTALNELIAELETAGHLAAGLDLTQIKSLVSAAFTDRVREHIWKEHGRPLRQVIGM